MGKHSRIEQTDVEALADELKTAVLQTALAEENREYCGDALHAAQERLREATVAVGQMIAAEDAARGVYQDALIAAGLVDTASGPMSPEAAATL